MRHLELKPLTRMRLFAPVLRPWPRSKSTRRGQALIELAVLGTVLIFCLTILLRYGMDAVYQQNQQMRTFRKAFVRASSREPVYRDWWLIFFNIRRNIRPGLDPGWEYENTEPPLPGDHWRNVNYTAIEDKPVFSASAGILPITERSPRGANIDAVRSIDLFGQMEFPDDLDNSNDSAFKDLPRVEYEINGRRYSFTTANYKAVTIDDVGNLRKKEDIPNWRGSGPYWHWEDVDFYDVEIGDFLDVDEDGHEESVIDIVFETYQEEDEYGNMVDKKRPRVLRLVDYQEGEINLTITDDSDEEQQGLQPDYDKQHLVSNSTFRLQETPTGTTTTDNISAEEVFNRIIRLNGTGEYPVQDTLTTDESTTWYTPRVVNETDPEPGQPNPPSGGGGQRRGLLERLRRWLGILPI